MLSNSGLVISHLLRSQKVKATLMCLDLTHEENAMDNLITEEN